MRTAALALLVASTRAAAVDPTCTTGIAHHSTCCAASCGSCGGSDCSSLPGGAAACCSEKISESNRSCAQYDPPCVIGPAPSPAPYPPIVTLGLGHVSIARVPDTFLSFTFDASAWRTYDLAGKDDASSGHYGETLDLLAASLGPAILRVGGTQADYDVYTNFSSASDGAGCEHLPPPMSSYRCRTVTPAQWASLLGFAARNRLQLVYGLNDMYGRPTKTKPETKLCSPAGACPPRNTTNYEALLEWTATQRPTGWEALLAFELGNELNSCLDGLEGARTQAADLKALRTNIQRIWQAAAPAAQRRATHRVPFAVGPDTHSAAEFSSAGREWFGEFATTVGDSVSALTFHEYALGNGPKLDPTTLATSFLSPTELDKSGSGVKALLAALPASPPPPPLWAGETAAANNGGQSGLTDTFVDSFWYLDQLGQLAALNVSAFLRQTLLASGGYPLVELEPSRAERREVPGAAGKVVADAPAHVLEGGSSVRPSPLPDYWLALLHKRLMGGTVLLANSTSAGVRLYAHCAVGGGVALAFLNLDESHTANLTLPRELEAATTRLEYGLTAGAPIPGAVNPLQSRQVRLNGGEPLALASGPALPPLEGKSVTQSDAPAVALPAASLGFVVWPEAHLGACARA